MRLYVVLLAAFVVLRLDQGVASADLERQSCRCPVLSAANATSMASAILGLPAPTAPFSLAVCTMFHNEGPYLLEWVLYHYLIGFQHFFMYDNESDDNPRAILQPLIDRKLVTYISWPGTQEKYYAQNRQLADCFNLLAPAKAKWMAGFDLDEFVVVLNQQATAQAFPNSFALHGLLRSFEEQHEGGIILDRVTFTSNGHEQRRPGLSIVEYTERVVEVRPMSAAGKVIVLTQAMKNMRTFHTVELQANWSVVAADHRPWVEHSKYRTFEPIRMNHYQQRSYEECLGKISTRLSPDHWRVIHGKTLCNRHMEGKEGYNKAATAVDRFLADSGFPDLILALKLRL